MIYSYMDSPVGRLLLAGEKAALKVISFSSGTKARGANPDWERLDEPFRGVKRQLEEYFAGERRSFSLQLAPDATPFQASVLDELLQIPYGETRSYLDIANALGKPKAVRAVGGANGSNPIPIVIPCHRVVARDGLGGFSGHTEGPFLKLKRWLLNHEGALSSSFAKTDDGTGPTTD